VTIAVIGCGLIGASIAGGLTRAGHTVWGLDRRDLSELVERRWLARQVKSEELPAARLVVLALPPDAICGALSRLPFAPGQVVTDTASVKVPIERAAMALPPEVAFVGGHPMAGDSRGGVEAARPDLFQGAVWVLSQRAAAGPRRQVEELVGELGAHPLTVDPERHDRLVAWTSHLPQLLATCLAAELEAQGDPLAEQLLGPGGRAFLRLARSPFPLWQEILSSNQEAVEAALAAVTARAGQPPQALAEDFAAAQRFAARLLESAVNWAPARKDST
jgi:prephenate dehydrogenase